MPTSDHQLLTSIEAKLSALLTLTLDSYLRETGIAKSKKRSVDTMLAAVGLTAQEIAALLGKTDRAVQLQLKADAGEQPAKKQPAKRSA